MTPRRRGLLLAALCWLGAGAGPLGAAGVGDGLAAYRAGDFAAAAEVFGAAAEQRPEEPTLLYNAGVSAYQDGDYEAARASLQQAVNYAARPELAAAGHLALGNTRMMEAEHLLQQQPAGAAAGAALQLLEGASASFERALRVAPGHPAAARNLELARMQIDLLRRQQPPPQQQQQGQQQQQQESGGQEQPPPGQPEDAPAADGGDDEDAEDAGEGADTGEGAGAPPPAGAAEEQPAPRSGAGQEGSAAPPEQTPEELARQIIAAEEANAARRRERQSRLQPVPRDW